MLMKIASYYSFSSFDGRLNNQVYDCVQWKWFRGVCVCVRMREEGRHKVDRKHKTILNTNDN